MRFAAAIVAATSLAVAHPHHHRPVNCARLQPRAELACAKAQLATARRTPAYHSHTYWRWREKVAHRWIADARSRIELAAAHVPNYGAAAYWTHRYFGYGYAADLMLCIANRESGYVLDATHQNYPTSLGVDHGPWQVNDVAHPWVNFTRIVRSWKYAAAVSWHLSGYGTDFSAWGGSC